MENSSIESNIVFIDPIPNFWLLGPWVGPRDGTLWADIRKNPISMNIGPIEPKRPPMNSSFQAGNESGVRFGLTLIEKVAAVSVVSVLPAPLYFILNKKGFIKLTIFLIYIPEFDAYKGTGSARGDGGFGGDRDHRHDRGRQNDRGGNILCI